MPPRGKTQAAKDRYANLVYDVVTESAANTLTFKEINLGLTIFQKVGILISRIEWYQWDTRLLADGDILNWGLSASNSFSTTNASEDSIITFHYKEVRDYGTAGNNHIFTTPMVDDFSTMPGGGILITPRPLYLFAEGSALGNPATVAMRLYFTIVELKPEEYFELLETRQYFG